MNLSRLRKHAEYEVSIVVYASQEKTSFRKEGSFPPDSPIVERVGWLQSMGWLAVDAVQVCNSAQHGTQHGTHGVSDVPLALPRTWSWRSDVRLRVQVSRPRAGGVILGKGLVRELNAREPPAECLLAAQAKRQGRRASASGQPRLKKRPQISALSVGQRRLDHGTLIEQVPSVDPSRSRSWASTL